MKVLLYGSNCASIINSLAIGLRQKGVEVKGLTYFETKYVNYDELEVLESGVKSLPKKILSKLRNNMKILRALLWCDVVHVFWDANDMVLKVAKLLGKRRIVTFAGSEIRRPSVTLQYNPYYKYAWENPKYEYRQLENDDSSMRRQTRFAEAGFGFVVWELPPYLDPKICKEVHVIPHASVNTISATASHPDGKVRIMHAPSAPVAKGSQYIQQAMEAVRQKHPEVEVQLVKGVTNEQYQKMVADCDIYIDQMIWGAYGVAAQQALLMGKTVVCYINDHLQEVVYPKDMPIQKATIDNLAEVLEGLVLDAEKRKTLAAKSREYYQQTHAPQVVAERMLQVYQQKP